MTTDTDTLRAQLAQAQAEARRLRKLAGLPGSGPMHRAEGAAVAILMAHATGLGTSRRTVCEVFPVSGRQHPRGVALLRYAGLLDSAGNVTRPPAQCYQWLRGVTNSLLVTGRYRAFLAGVTGTTHVCYLHATGNILAEIVTG